MGQIHKIGDEYYIEFTARGLVYQQKAGNDLAKAEVLLRSVEEKIANGEAMTLAREIDWDIFFAEYLKNARMQYHPATIRRLQSTVVNFSEFLKGSCPQVSRLSQITPRVIEDYKNYGIKKRTAATGGLNPKVINLTLLLLREILEHGIKTGFINDNPTLHVRLLDSGAPLIPALSGEELSGLIKHVPDPYLRMFVFMRYTGLRPSELVTFSWQQVDFNRQVIFVRLREIPMMPEARDILNVLFDKVIDHKAAVFTGVSEHLENVFAEARVRAKLPERLSLAGIRYAFAVDLLQRRIPLLTIGRMMGIADAAKLMAFAPYIPLIRQDI